MKLYTIFILLVLLLAVSPVLAETVGQETIVVDNGTVPLVMQQNELYPLVVTGLLFVLLATLTVLGYSIRSLFQSAPPWMQPLVKQIIDAGLLQAEQITTKTPTKADDALLAQIRIMIEEALGTKLLPMTMKVSGFESVGAVIGEVVSDDE